MLVFLLHEGTLIGILSFLRETLSFETQLSLGLTIVYELKAKRLLPD